MRLCAENRRRVAHPADSPVRRKTYAQEHSPLAFEDNSWLFQSVSAKQDAQSPWAGKQPVFAQTSIERKENDSWEDRNRREGPGLRINFTCLGDESMELMRPPASLIGRVFSPLKLDARPAPCAFRSENKPSGKGAALLFSEPRARPQARL